jgi:hypothetical protein
VCVGCSDVGRASIRLTSPPLGALAGRCLNREPLAVASTSRVILVEKLGEAGNSKGLLPLSAVGRAREDFGLSKRGGPNSSGDFSAPGKGNDL